MRMEAALFEDEAWVNFTPISSNRHLAQQLSGDATVYEHVARRLKGAELSLLGRNYLAKLAAQCTGMRYNQPEGTTLFINARISPLVDIARWAKLPVGSVVTDRGDVAVASLRAGDIEKATSADGTLSRKRLASIAKSSQRLESPAPLLFTYPWDFIESNGDVIRASAKKAPNNLAISPKVQLEEYVSLDTRGGPIIVEDGARIEAFSRLSGPCYIGNGTVLHSALVRGGTTIAQGCRIGGETEVSIIYRRATKVHFGFLGHSILGEWANFAAGAVTSDLKHTFGHVRVLRGRETVDSGLQKVGTFIGDMAKVSIGTMIYAGKTLGVAARVEGLIRKDIPAFVDYSSHTDSTTRLDLAKVIVMQERAKKRRDEPLTTEERDVMRYIYRTPG